MQRAIGTKIKIKTKITEIRKIDTWEDISWSEICSQTDARYL